MISENGPIEAKLISESDFEYWFKRKVEASRSPTVGGKIYSRVNSHYQAHTASTCERPKNSLSGLRYVKKRPTFRNGNSEPSYQVCNV